jgi:hypothetical protein
METCKGKGTTLKKLTGKRETIQGGMEKIQEEKEIIPLKKGTR